MSADEVPIATIDTTGLRCPLPLLKVRKAMRSLAAGEVARILATDPDTETDLKAYCEATGCTFISAAITNGVFEFRIKQSANSASNRSSAV